MTTPLLQTSEPELPQLSPQIRCWNPSRKSPDPFTSYTRGTEIPQYWRVLPCIPLIVYAPHSTGHRIATYFPIGSALNFMRTIIHTCAPSHHLNLLLALGCWTDSDINFHTQRIGLLWMQASQPSPQLGCSIIFMSALHQFTIPTPRFSDQTTMPPQRRISNPLLVASLLLKYRIAPVGYKPSMPTRSYPK